MDASFVYAYKDPSHILQFDRLNRSTQLPPIDFPQFNTIDSLDNWSIIRLGVRNRLQTRRDNDTLNWFELDTYIDVKAGEVLVIPSMIRHRAEALEDTLDVDVFNPPRQDWLDGTDAYLRSGSK